MGGFSVLNNLASLAAQQQSAVTQAQLQKTLFRLSSGKRIVTGGDDAAGLSIADGLQAQIRSLQQSVRNANDGIGFIQTADSALGQVTNLLNRAATLLTEAATGTNSDSLTEISAELTQIYQEIDRVGTATTFNGTTVFSGSSVSIFVGDTTNATTASAATVSFTVQSLSTTALGIDVGGQTGTNISVTLADASAAQTMLNEVNSAIDTVAGWRGTLGAKLNRLENSVNIMQAQIQNLTAAESQIRDADMAAEIANMTKFQILSQVGLASMAQANATSQSVLSLLR
ncbi:MAG: flagellin [Acidobacteriota bacterium]